MNHTLPWRANLPQHQKLTWNKVKAKLRDYDHRALMGLLQDLYDSSKDNQAFLHARLGLGEDALRPFKEAINRWLWPDISRNQDISIPKAKKAISDYRKAAGRTEELADLIVFYCEQASGFSNDVGLDDVRYFDALV